MKIKNKKYLSNWKWNTLNDIIGDIMTDINSGEVLSYESSTPKYMESLTEKYLNDIIELNEMEIQFINDYLIWKSETKYNKFHSFIGKSESKFEFVSSKCDQLIRSIKEGIAEGVPSAQLYPSIVLAKQTFLLPKEIYKLFSAYMKVALFLDENRKPKDLKETLDTAANYLTDNYDIEELIIVVSADYIPDGGISVCIENVNNGDSIIKHLRSELVHWEYKNDLNPNHDNNTGDEIPILLSKVEED